MTVVGRMGAGLTSRVVVLVVALLLLTILLTYAYLNQPLNIITYGLVSSSAEPDVYIDWELENTGGFPVYITQVEIVGSRGGTPIWTRGVTVDQDHGWIHGAKVELPNWYTVLNLDWFRVPPYTSRRSEGTPDNPSAQRYGYGLVTAYHFDRQYELSIGTHMIVHYRYMGLPFKLVFTTRDGRSPFN